MGNIIFLQFQCLQYLLQCQCPQYILHYQCLPLLQCQCLSLTVPMPISYCENAYLSLTVPIPMPMLTSLTVPLPIFYSANAYLSIIPRKTGLPLRATNIAKVYTVYMYCSINSKLNSVHNWFGQANTMFCSFQAEKWDKCLMLEALLNFLCHMPDATGLMFHNYGKCFLLLSECYRFNASERMLQTQYGSNATGRKLHV